MSVDSRGRIMVVNGTSSSGKSTLVRALQAAAPDLWLEMGIDRFAYALPGRVDGKPAVGEGEHLLSIETTALGTRFISGMHATAAALADAGFDVIVDHVILEPGWVAEMRRLWARFDVLFVGVRCPLEIVLERERGREDRTIGQAEAQFDVIHRWTTYDVEVDTSVLTPAEAASRILAALEKPPR